MTYNYRGGAKARRAAALKAAQEIIDNRMSLGGDFTGDERAQLDQLEAELKECNEQLAKSANADAMLDRLKGQGAGPDPSRPVDTKAPHRVSFAGKSTSKAARELAARTGVAGVKGLLNAGSSATLPMDVLGGLVVPEGRPASSIFELIPAVKVDNGSQFSFLKQTARDLRAAPVAKGGTKPTSTATIERVNGELSVIAHIIEGLDTYDLNDAPALTAFIEDEMAYGLEQAVAAQLFSGDGVAPNLTGLLNTSGTVAQPFAVNAAVTIRKTITRLETSGYNPAAIFMNPNDWEGIETTMLTSGAFMLGNGPAGAPLDATARRLWGVRVALSNAIPEGKALTMGEGAAALYHDGTVRLDFDTSRGFKVNEVDARMEGRFGLAVSRPDALVEATLTDA